MKPKDTYFSPKRMLNLGGKLVSTDKPIVMGILNVTPDSFFAGSRFQTEDSIKKRANQILSEGAAIIDIGAASSRPGATVISEDEERKRLELAFTTLRQHFNQAILSVDTYRASIAEWAVKEFGVAIVNDISAGSLDAKMFETIACLNVPYVLMHMRGTPENMQQNVNYNDVIKELVMFFSEKIDQLRKLGVNDIIIDPGFGFGKSVDDNFTLLRNIDVFRFFELPILIGVSRKSMIWKTLDILPEEALNGTTVLHTFALSMGADILRVHDVKEAVETVNLINKLYKN